MSALAALLLAACSSLPSARLAESPWAALPDDGDLYLFADVRQARGLLEPLASDFFQGEKPRRVARLLDRCQEAYACLYLPAAEPAAGRAAGPAAELAVTGRWSPDLVSAHLSWSCGWVRREPAPPVPASRPYWSARRGALEIGSPAPGLLLAAAGRPGALQGMLARRLEAIPSQGARASDPRVDPFLAGAALYARLPVIPGAEPGSGPAGQAGGLPLRELWLAARRQGDRYELGALASLVRAADGALPGARALTGLVRLAAASLLRKAGIPEVAARLRAVEITAVGSGLSVRGLMLSEPELLALLQGVLLPRAAGDAGAAGGADARRGD